MFNKSIDDIAWMARPYAPRSPARMKKRLRKKKRHGEFAEWGRHLIATRKTRENGEPFLDAFLTEAIEAHGCFFGGLIVDNKIKGVVELGRKSNDPDAKYAEITAWLDSRPDVQDWKSGPLFDLWHEDIEVITDGDEQEHG